MAIFPKLISVVLLMSFLSVRAEKMNSSDSCGIRGDLWKDSLHQPPQPTRQYGFLGLGISEAGLSRLNSKLDSTGLSPIRKFGFSLGFGGRLEIRRLMLEGVISGSAWEENVDRNIRTSLYAADAIGRMGVNLLPESLPVTLSPYAGLGLGINWLKIRRDKQTLTEAIESSDPNVNIYQVTFLTQLGMALDFIFPSQDGTKGFVLGLRGGYQFAPIQSNWYSDDTPISDMPDMKQGGIFAKLILGGWHPMQHRHCCCERR